MWLDAVTDLDQPRPRPGSAWSRAEWVEATDAGVAELVEPVAAGVADAVGTALEQAARPAWASGGLPEGLVPPGIEPGAR